MVPCLVTDEPYTPRSPQKSQYYRCVESHFEELERVWEERYQHKYGYWRPYVTEVIYKYTEELYEFYRRKFIGAG